MTRLSEPCACGRLIVAGAPWRVMDAVQAHNATAEHRRWRRGREVALANALRRARLRGELETLRLQRWSARDRDAMRSHSAATVAA